MSSPTPKSRWGRMGGVVRRASSVLVAARPSTPSIASDKDADNASIKGASTSAPGTPVPPTLVPPEVSRLQQSSVPSPIAESPAREAAAQEEATPVGPSPLGQEPAAPVITETSPQDYTPPPLLDSHTAGLGPGAFTDEPDELPQSEPIKDPSILMGSAEGHSSSSHLPGPSVTSVSAEPKQIATEPVTPTTPEPEPPVVPLPEPTPVPEPPLAEPVPAAAEPVTPPPETGSAKSYFDIPTTQNGPEEDANAPSASHPAVTDTFKQSIEANTLGEDSGPTTETTTVRPEEPAPEPTREIVEDTHPDPAPAQMPTPGAEPIQLPAAPAVYPMPTFDMNAGPEVWGGVAHKPIGESRSVTNRDTSTRASSIHMPMEDPFADPIAPRIAVSHVDGPVMMPNPHSPEPQHSELHDNANGTIVMPLPPLHEVVPSKSINDLTSIQSVKSNNRGNFETDETLPLLSNQNSPKNTSYLQPSSTNYVNVSPLSGMPAPNYSSGWSQVQPTTHEPRLHSLGWIEYQLPDGTLYYVHPTRRVTTDIDLRVDKKLDAITGYLIHHYKESDGAPAGMELWLREPVKNTKRGAKPAPPVRCWVDHRKRTVVIDLLHENGGSKNKTKDEDEDQLDKEYRYWSFVEAHPAHASLPPNARTDAMDVLTWAWTDRLLPSHRTIPAPFTQEECQELMSLLRSFGDQADSGLQAVVHVRMISRILLRVAHWRQEHFRPKKPLPKDVSSNELRVPTPRRPFRRALFDFLISCLCLGIPYMFFERSQYQRIDEEGGMRHAAPMLVVGACTCLIAAVVLSASVTFLSLPGLDNVSRVAGFVAILFASFSMASTLVALFRYKADLERPVSHVGGEGLVMLSRRSVVMSLPLVFLAYATIGFVTGIVLYSFRGVSVADPLSTEHHFEDYTRWTVVGVLGGLAGMLTTSLLLLRR